TPFEAKPLSAPAIRLATQVPWPSLSSLPQSVRPAFLSALSPNSCLSASQGTKVSALPAMLSVSCRCDFWTPVSRTATLTVLSPSVVAQAAGTFMRASSHWRIPCGLVTPRNEDASCHGSAKEPDPPKTGEPTEPPRSLPSRVTGPSNIDSRKKLATCELAPILAPKSGAVGATAIAPTGLRSVTTSPPAFAMAARICPGVVALSNRTIEIPNGFGLSLAEAGATARSAAAQRDRKTSRFTAQLVSAGAALDLMPGPSFATAERRAAQRRPFVLQLERCGYFVPFSCIASGQAVTR